MKSAMYLHVIRILHFFVTKETCQMSLTFVTVNVFEFTLEGVTVLQSCSETTLEENRRKLDGVN